MRHVPLFASDLHVQLVAGTMGREVGCDPGRLERPVSAKATVPILRERRLMARRLWFGDDGAR
jgi:hypothetical protein